MTDFSDAINWSINNIPMYDKDDFADWLNEVLANLRGGDKLKNNTNLHKGLEKAWINEFGSLQATPKGETIKGVREEFSQRGYEPERDDKTIRQYNEQQEDREERQYPSEEARQVPKTGSAPVITTIQYSQAVARVSRVRRFVNFFKGRTSSPAEPAPEPRPPAEPEPTGETGV